MDYTEELAGLNHELSMFPQRLFHFSCGDVLIDQDVGDVGSVVWDAEVVLAHSLDEVFGKLRPGALRGRRVLELGAGTGLAGIVAARLGATVVLTEQAKLLEQLRANVRANIGGGGGSSSSSSRNEKDEQGGEAHVVELKWSLDTAALFSQLTMGGVAQCQAMGGAVAVGDTATVGETTTTTAAAAGGGGGGGAEGETHRATTATALPSTDILPLSSSSSPCSAVDFAAPYDLILASDIIYLEALWGEMVATCQALVRSRGAVVLMSYEQRRRPVEAFFDMLPKLGGGEGTGPLQEEERGDEEEVEKVGVEAVQAAEGPRRNNEDQQQQQQEKEEEQLVIQQEAEPPHRPLHHHHHHLLPTEAAVMASAAAAEAHEAAVRALSRAREARGRGGEDGYGLVPWTSRVLRGAHLEAAFRGAKVRIHAIGPAEALGRSSGDGVEKGEGGGDDDLTSPAAVLRSLIGEQQL